MKANIDMRKWLLIVLLLFSLTNVHAEHETFRSPFENSYNNDTKFLPNTSLDNVSSGRNPFDSEKSELNIYRILGDIGDRPGSGDGIGQVTVKDDLIFLILLAIVYGLYIKYHKKKTTKKN